MHVLNEPAGGSRYGQVGGHHVHAHLERRELTLDIIETIAPARGENQVAAAFREIEGHRAPDPGARAGDERGAAAPVRLDNVQDGTHGMCCILH